MNCRSNLTTTVSRVRSTPPKIRRRQPRTAKHQATVVFHPSSQPKKETTHG